MNATKWGKMKKAEFEDKLVNSVSDSATLSKRSTYENGVDKDGNDFVTKLWLYYKSDIHIGTWEKGECWVFETNF